jgi:urease accessory protein
MLHTAGGVVGGDRLSSAIQLQPQAQALLTTAAAMKIYGGEVESQQEIQIQVGEGACLEWLPQEAIVFDGANYRQTLRVDLAPSATWIGWEMTRLGRSARGERFQSGAWRSHTEVWQAGRLLWVDPQWILGGSEMMKSIHGLAGCSVVGSFAMVGQTVSKEEIRLIRERWAESIEDIGVTRLMNGLLCRYRGHSTAAARRYFMEAWDVVRSGVLGRSRCVPRVW